MIENLPNNKKECGICIAEYLPNNNKKMWNMYSYVVASSTIKNVLDKKNVNNIVAQNMKCHWVGEISVDVVA